MPHARVKHGRFRVRRRSRSRKGRSTILAPMRPRSPSTDHSISSGASGRSPAPSDASAIIFLSVGDQQVLVARPTWVPA